MPLDLEDAGDKKFFTDEKTQGDYFAEVATHNKPKCKICGVYEVLHNTMNHEFEKIQIQEREKSEKK